MTECLKEVLCFGFFFFIMAVKKTNKKQTEMELVPYYHKNIIVMLDPAYRDFNFISVCIFRKPLLI